MGIFWLASYPKSGNTWTRALLAHYFRQDNVALNDLGYDGIASRSFFDDVVGLPSANLLQDEIEQYYPQMCRLLSEDAGDERLFFKVHAANLVTGSGERLFPSAVGSAVYIVRNPLDVAASLAPFFGWTPRRAATTLGDDDYVLNASDNNPTGMLPERLRSWTAHVRSWLDAPGLRVHVVRFEDLREDTEDTFTRLLRFAGASPDPERVRTAVEQARFERLREAELEHGFNILPKCATAPFFREGRVGSWRDELPAESARQLVAAHRTTMVRLGYDREVAEVLQNDTR